jgi:hypothetical protein
MPTPRLLSERQFEAVASQSALVDDSEVTPNWAYVSGSHIRRKGRLAFNGLIEHVEVILRECRLYILPIRENDALIEARLVNFCNSM